MKRYVLLALCATVTQAQASQTFDQMWSDRIVAFIRNVKVSQVHVDDIPAELLKPPSKEDPVEEKKPQHKHRESDDDDCLTLREARKKYPLRYLSWRGDHCWFAPGRHR